MSEGPLYSTGMSGFGVEHVGFWGSGFGVSCVGVGVGMVGVLGCGFGVIVKVRVTISTDERAPLGPCTGDMPRNMPGVPWRS